MSCLEPYKLEPVLLQKIWGGKNLFDLLHKGNGKDGDIGESWELSDNDTAQNKIAEGCFAGQSFRDVYQKYSGEILGRYIHTYLKQIPRRFPLLYKFIDANTNLSVQVHPGERSGLGTPKSEAWYVVDAPAEAKIIVGIASQDKPEKILTTLKTSDAPKVLNHIPVSTGDTLIIPAGTVHAITSGLVIYEIQQNSDTTFRLYDWDRVDAHGKSRTLHFEEAARCIDYTIHKNHKVESLRLPAENCDISVLVACSYFSLFKYENIKNTVPIHLNGKFKVVTCLKKDFTIVYQNRPYRLHTGETILIPAGCNYVELEDNAGGAIALMSTIPDMQEEIITPLKKAGYTMPEINQLGGIRGLSW
ncbi:MAG: class I mannose-6-phosphate isomerase [Fibrobacteria bacterium]|nr:class I mannose-6-phosphate isomerase [Fibrobacteria bacterium]